MSNLPDNSHFTRSRAGLFAGPVVFAVMLLLPSPETMEPVAWRVAATAALMAIWWITEAIPIPATALLPIVLFPILDAGTVAEATQPFANPIIYLFLGGFIIALAMERTGLHKRVALGIVRGVGTSPHRIVLGFMIASAFMSMWVSNTATALMMLPIALAIITLVEKSRTEESGPDTNFGLAMLLGLAYACNIGGIATLIGTPPNAIMAGYMLDNYGVEIGFGQWMLFGLPLVLVSLPIVFLYLIKVAFPISLKDIPGGTRLLREQFRSLGSITGPEKMVGIVFIMTAFLWITRPLLQAWIPNLSDTGIAIFGAFLMFLMPVNFRKMEFVLSWSDVQALPWGVLILFGGGLSLAYAITDSGLAEWIGRSLHLFGILPVILLIAATLFVIVFLTEITSNTATAATFIPILASVAIALGYDPLILVIPAAIAASCAFMLPVATPPNAIVFGSGYVSIPQMARAGLAVNLLLIFITTLAIYAGIGWVFGVGS